MPILDTILGIPFDEEARERAFENLVGDLKGGEAFTRILAGVQHNTEKAGALLAAQGVFIVACTFAIDHGWPRLPVLSAILLLSLGALLAMSILRSTSSPFHRQTDPARAGYSVLISRMIRFNLALYMTFLSVLLLGFSAILLEV
jgi:hypothetical protein